MAKRTPVESGLSDSLRPNPDTGLAKNDDGNAIHSGRFKGRRVHRRGCPGRSPQPADRPPGMMISGRCPSGTSSAGPSPTSRLISASPGNRHLLPQRVPPPLISRLPVAPGLTSQTPPRHVPTPQRYPRRSRLSLDLPYGPRWPLVPTPPWARRGACIPYPLASWSGPLTGQF